MTAWRGWKSRVPTRPLLVGVGVGPRFILCLAGVERLLSNVFFLLDFPFPGPLAGESKSLGGYLVSTYWYSRLPTSSLPSLGYKRQRKGPEKLISLMSVLFLTSQDPYLVCFFSPSLRAFSCLFYIYCPGVSLYLMEGIGKIVSTPFSWKPKATFL